VDDFLLFSNDKSELLEWRKIIIKRLVNFRLTLHEDKAQARPVTEGIPFLGFHVFPDHRRLKRRKGIAFQRKYRQLLHRYKKGEVSNDQVSASIRGWVNHVRYGDTWGLRRSIFDNPSAGSGQASNL
jgi:hypothetical protein